MGSDSFRTDLRMLVILTISLDSNKADIDSSLGIRSLLTKRSYSSFDATNLVKFPVEV